MASGEPKVHLFVFSGGSGMVKLLLELCNGHLLDFQAAPSEAPRRLAKLKKSCVKA